MRTRADDSSEPPRAPSVEAWSSLTTEQRREVVASLGTMTDAEMSPPEGDKHLDGKMDARDTLREWFRRRGKSVYVGSEITTYYPAEPRFAPDVLVVFDVPVHDRTTWVVSAEGKGLDWVLEVHVGGDRKKDAELNVARYARLGIPEYFIYDRDRERLYGHRLASPSARTYSAIVPQSGRYASHVLDLDLALEGGRLRFYQASAELLTPRDLAAKLEGLVADMASQRDAETERARAEAERARTEAERARAEAERAERAELEIERLRAELEALKKKG
jgi:Uma2 family endonuclease